MAFWAVGLVSLTVVVQLATSYSFSSTGTSVKLNNVYFFVSPFSSGTIGKIPIDQHLHKNTFGFIPVTIISDSSELQLQSLFADWAIKDDVWQPSFLETVLVANMTLDESTLGNATYYGNISSQIFPLRAQSSTGQTEVPSGPYFLNLYTWEVHQVYRLYDDVMGAFTQSVLQQPDDKFQTLSAQIPSAASLTIGVPSRLYFQQTAEKPLAGVRIGVKDLYSLAGVKKSCGSRAYYGLYPPSNVTCTAIQNLIDAGAVIVGVQKLSQFANGETATADWVDYHSPFNPRGDGYQDTASSSAGAGASIGAYGWLDIAVGSDTGGSIRGPASNQGVFGNRPSHGLVSLENVMPLSPRMDTAGFLTRDPVLWDNAHKAMYQENYTSFSDKAPEWPSKLYTLDFPNDDDTHAPLLNKFTNDLATFMNASISKLDLNQEWLTTGPEQVNKQNISQFLNLTYTALITMDQIGLLRDPFYADYAAVHDGRLPFVDPSPFRRWAWGEVQPESMREDAVKNKTLFMNWFNAHILPADPNPLTCSSSLILHTDSTGYFSSVRNQYRDPPALPFGFSNGEISIFTEVPDSVFPLGQIPVFSDITNHTEYLPVSVDILAAKGCDGLITKLAQDLVKEGILVIPQTGSTLEGGDVLL